MLAVYIFVIIINMKTPETINIFENKTIILGLTGALTCFKICSLISRLKKQGARFRIVASENALNFITKTTLQTLAKTEVLTTQFNPKKFDENHKSLTEEGDIFLLAPATAQTISKIAHGVADNLLTSVICAWQKPMLIAPAMNQGMWFNPSTQENISTLRKRGAVVMDAPKGALPGIDLIYSELENILKLSRNLQGKKILITNGNTSEQFGNGALISQLPETNLGKCLADIAHLRGAEITLITTEIFDAPYEQVLVKDTDEMRAAVSKNIAKTDCFFMAASLAPYKPHILKSGAELGVKSEELLLTLINNNDFFPYYCAQKRPHQIFAWITEKTEFDNKSKRCPKGCDYLVEGVLQGSQEDSIFCKHGLRTIIEKKATRQELAAQILDLIFRD